MPLGEKINMKEKPIIFTKWILILPIVIFFATMFFGLAFHDPAPSTNAPFNECERVIPTASTKVCP